MSVTDQMYQAKTFDEFWGYYQDLHASRSVRIAHAIGTTSAIGLLVAAALRRSWKLGLAAPVIDYVISQSSHRAESLTTHPYKKPLWHARAELRLWRSTIRSILDRRGGRGEPIDDDPIELP